MLFRSDYPELPVPSQGNNRRFGSDYLVEILRDLEVPFVALNPGASFRGLHDSLVNHLGNQTPQMLLCLHEEHAVAIAHGYAKVTGKPMAAVVHSNVGLMHASMAVFNAFCDRVPVLLLGATGPVDAERRRPWIDWIHTSQDQGALIRNFVKWDDQPASVEAGRESLLRAYQLATTDPAGPVYINLDVGLQEDPADEAPRARSVSRYQTMSPSSVSDADLEKIVSLLKGAKNPLILIGRVSRAVEAWDRRIALAEALGAKVASDFRLAAAFPTQHPLNTLFPPFPSDSMLEIVRQADVILSLNWLDLGGLFKVAFPGGEPSGTVISATLDHTLHNGWTKDHLTLPAVDIAVQTTPDALVAQLCDKLAIRAGDGAPRVGDRAPVDVLQTDPDHEMSVAELAAVVTAATDGMDRCFIRLPIGCPHEVCDFTHPLDFLGQDGGGGIGSGPGMAVGAALALKDSGRLPVLVTGDGDFLMGCTAIWTAVRYGIPLLVVVSNNRSFFNDEMHQERVARTRGRPVENRWIGQRIDGPAPDLAKIAEGQGAAGFGPVATPRTLRAALDAAIPIVERGGVAVIDAVVVPQYDATTTAAIRGDR